MMTDKCLSNQYTWFALVSLLRSASFMELVPVPKAMWRRDRIGTRRSG